LQNTNYLRVCFFLNKLAATSQSKIMTIGAISARQNQETKNIKTIPPAARRIKKSLIKRFATMIYFVEILFLLC